MTWIGELIEQFFTWIQTVNPVTALIIGGIIVYLTHDKVKIWLKKKKHSNPHKGCSNEKDMLWRASEMAEYIMKQSYLYYQKIMEKEMVEVEDALFQIENMFTDKFGTYLHETYSIDNPTNSKEYKEYIILVNKIIHFSKELLRYSMKRNGFQNKSDKEFEYWLDKKIDGFIKRISMKISDIFGQNTFDTLSREELRSFHENLIPEAQNKLKEMYRNARQIQADYKSEIHHIDDNIEELFPGLETSFYESNNKLIG